MQSGNRFLCVSYLELRKARARSHCTLYSFERQMLEHIAHHIWLIASKTSAGTCIIVTSLTVEIKAFFFGWFGWLVGMSMCKLMDWRSGRNQPKNWKQREREREKNVRREREKKGEDSLVVFDGLNRSRFHVQFSTCLRMSFILAIACLGPLGLRAFFLSFSIQNVRRYNQNHHFARMSNVWRACLTNPTRRNRNGAGVLAKYADTKYIMKRERKVDQIPFWFAN